jgi:hypothetical protein
MQLPAPPGRWILDFDEMDPTLEPLGSRRGQFLHAQFLQVLQRDFHALQRRIGVFFFLDDIPFRAADGAAQVEDLRPVDVALANHGVLVRGGVFLQVDGARPAGIALQVLDRVGAAAHGVAEVELHDDVLAGVAGQDVPAGGVADGGEVVGVVVITFTASSLKRLA